MGVSWLEGLDSSSGVVSLQDSNQSIDDNSKELGLDESKYSPNVGASESSDQTIDVNAQELTALRAEVQELRANDIPKMKQQHDIELQQVEEKYQARLRELEEQQNATMDYVEKEHTRQLEQHLASIDTLQKKNTRQLEEHLASIDALKKEHEQQLENLVGCSQRLPLEPGATSIEAGYEHMRAGLPETKAKEDHSAESKLAALRAEVQELRAQHSAGSTELIALRAEAQESKAQLQKAEAQLRDSNHKLQVLSTEGAAPTSSARLELQTSWQQVRDKPSTRDSAADTYVASQQQQTQQSFAGVSGQISDKPTTRSRCNCGDVIAAPQQQTQLRHAGETGLRPEEFSWFPCAGSRH